MLVIIIIINFLNVHNIVFPFKIIQEQEHDHVEEHILLCKIYYPYTRVSYRYVLYTTHVGYYYTHNAHAHAHDN